MNTDVQESFLNNIAHKLGRNRRSGVTPPKWNNNPLRQFPEEINHESLVEQFITNLNALHTEVSHIYRSEIESALQYVVQKFDVQSAVYWDDERLHQLQIGEHLTRNFVSHRIWQSKEEERELRDYADQVDMGITYAEMGLAETGTVVLWNGSGRGRLVSVLPPVYVAILSEHTIYRRLTEGVTAVHEHVPNGLPACINFITGPSRTGDIEMELAFGVHGPGKVHVILLKD
ncbi:LutC/YkgG family protein [Bacillus pseudomycoides]|uniref:LutC/YkgG family protein n=1 Tax=Bacillus pseudomycoides TaxID=64104 RepID=UPI000BEE5228|nr:lactate utilization protein C [Bacillus pseudomycoides]PEE40842.1 lactate utilization protein C [Bacillus pseudomycoides]PEI92952.1 lactate utilization protein C [Bacillus pseudomycoides]PGA90968.1 lactate utilization protein C [Bacillus pseudomycoides]PHF47051.1 lactate utilization protein C [Bacillus pseudomycoides]